MLSKRLSERLMEEGIVNLVLNVKVKYRKGNLLQQIALEIIKGKAKLGEKTVGEYYYIYDGIKIGKRGREEEGIIIKKGIDNYLRNMLIDYLKKQPVFIIDLSFWKSHSYSERRRIDRQIYQSLGVINQYLYHKTNLLLIDPPEKLETFPYRDRSFYDELENAVILDPNSDETLTEEDVKKYDYFLIGGIVDVGIRWEGATQVLFKDLSFPKKKIELDGSIKGVPDRINTIIGIILDVRYSNLSLREAIIRNQTLKDVLERLSYEIKKYDRILTLNDLLEIGKNVNRHPRELKYLLEKYFNRRVIL